MGDGSLGKIYYDYPNYTQRVDHWNNTASRHNQCFFWFGRSDPCVGYFVPVGMGEQYVYFPQTDECCLESCEDVCDPSIMNVSDGTCCREAGVYLPKPTAASECRYVSRVVLDGMDAFHFKCPVCLNYYFDAATMAPLRFSSDDENYVVNFAPDSVKPLESAASFASLLELPAACTPDIKCKGFLGATNLNCSF